MALCSLSIKKILKLGEIDLKKILSLFLVLLLSFTLISCSELEGLIKEEVPDLEVGEIEENGYFTSKEELALYIHTYKKLPKNFITKKEAMKLGWESQKGNLWEVTDKKSIGGNRFGNREGKLPKKDGREYFEADVNYRGEYRGPERIVYSNDGLIYYTDDHYETFTLLYGDD